MNALFPSHCDHWVTIRSYSLSDPASYLMLLPAHPLILSFWPTAPQTGRQIDGMLQGAAHDKCVIYLKWRQGKSTCGQRCVINCMWSLLIYDTHVPWYTASMYLGEWNCVCSRDLENFLGMFIVEDKGTCFSGLKKELKTWLWDMLPNLKRTSCLIFF